MIKFLKYLSLYFVKGEIKVYLENSNELFRKRKFVNGYFRYWYKYEEGYARSCYTYGLLLGFKICQLYAMYKYDKGNLSNVYINWFGR